MNERESGCKITVEAKSPTKAREACDAHIYRFDVLGVRLPVPVPGRQGASSYRYKALRSALLELVKKIKTASTSETPSGRRFET